MRKPRSFHPACPPAGTFYIHDDAVWLAGDRTTSRVGWIRRSDAMGFCILVQGSEHAPIRQIAEDMDITEARAKLKRLLKSLASRLA